MKTFGTRKTPEQEVRNMLERAGVEDAQNFTAGDLVEVANLIAYIEKLEKAFLDVLDGGNSNWWEIQQNTGLPEERCKEIEGIYSEVWKNYKERHGFNY